MRFFACLSVVALGLAAVAIHDASACGGGCGCCATMPRPVGSGTAAPASATPAGCCKNGMKMNGMKMNGMDMKGMSMQSAAPAAKAPAKSKRVTLAVAGMHCEKCPAHVTAALQAVPSVKQVLVDPDQQEAVVLVDAGKYDAKALLGALKQAGFEGKVQQ